MGTAEKLSQWADLVITLPDLMRLLTGLPETELGKDFPVGVAGLEKLSQDEGGELVELLDAGVRVWSPTQIHSVGF